MQDTLYYCMFYHPNADETRLSSPKNMRKAYSVATRFLELMQQLSDPRYIWTALRSRAMIGDWDTVRALSVSKGFFSSKDKSIIGFRPFVQASVRLVALTGQGSDGQ
jgi:hypothetical protein